MAGFLLQGKAELAASGLGLSTWLRGMVLTALCFTLINTCLAWMVDRSYYSAMLPRLHEARSTDEAVQEVVELVGAEARMGQQDFIRAALRDRSPEKTAREYLYDLVQGLQGELAPQVQHVLDEGLTGNRRGLFFYVVRADSVSGTAIVEAMRQVYPSWNHKTALLEDGGGEVRGEDADAFLAKFIDRIGQETRPALRNLMRFNGWIQWWTVCVCIVILLLALARAALLARFVVARGLPGSSSPAMHWLARCAAPGASTETPSDPADGGAAELDHSPTHHEATVDRQVYATYEHLITLLPSLGFIGTVLGMGDALLSADSLFGASDKSQAISTITSHLGFAFDTTLIGLVTGIVAGSAVLRLRLWERSLWRAAGQTTA